MIYVCSSVQAFRLFILKQVTIFRDLVAENSGVQCFGLRGFTPLQRTGQAFGLGNPWSCLDGKLLRHLTWDVDPILLCLKGW